MAVPSIEVVRFSWIPLWPSGTTLKSAITPVPLVTLPSLDESMNANRFRVLLSGNMVSSIVVSGSVVVAV